MKKIFYIVLATVLAWTGCKKSSGDPVPGTAGMSFTATASQTKSHFGVDDTNLTLYWDDYDNMAVYSVNPEDADPAANAVSAIAYIRPEGVGQTTAQFMSATSREAWFANPATNGTKHFFSYYPAYGQPMYFEDVDGVGKVLPVYLDDDQRGKSDYGRYHFMISRGGSFGSEDNVVFQDFTPLTCLLKFSLKMEGGFDYSISSVYVRNYFYGKQYPESTEDTFHREYQVDPGTGAASHWITPESLAGFRYVKVSDLLSDGDIRLYDYYPEHRWESNNRTSLYLLGMEGPYELGTSAGAPLYAVVFPTEGYPTDREMALGVSANYSVDVGDHHSYQVEHEGYIRIPSPGFVGGKRYDFVLTLTPDEMYLQNDPNAPAWGYDVVTW